MKDNKKIGYTKLIKCQGDSNCEELIPRKTRRMIKTKKVCERMFQ